MSRHTRLCAVLVALVAAAGGPAAAAPRSPSIPPPTPVPPVGSPSPYPTSLDTPPPSAEDPKVEAAAAALADLDSGRVLFESGTETPRPIASITKVMTALLVIERTRPTETVIAGPNASGQTGAELGLQPGEELTVRDLLTALLLQSANDAAVALAEHVSGSVDTFVAEMNARAGDLGMLDTEFQSPTGLDDNGRSTARDLLILASEAFLNATFAEIVSTRFATVPAEQGEPRRLQNRNALLWLYEGAFGGKTGYTAAAGFCLVAAAERDGLRLAAVVLGAPEQAFDASAELLNHGFAAWEREGIVTLGEEAEPLSVEGESVPTEADSTLSVLKPRGSVIDTEVDPDPGLSLPVDAGDPVGSLVATLDGRALGRVTLVAAEPVAKDRSPAPVGRGSLWEQMWSSLTRFYGRVYEALSG
ncbi:MAG: D-alanyl-D-alanine carboxypeptidase family protein [Actinomycetota bacterium]